ncbi:uncharacterized protein At4g02000-like [Cannabis sativa]|uniref:uncharacterized protein At4g02000-like n=1 Tax=Cannabis sativa TaxID=3483 RepID=UPI0029CA36B1|nr:uncharacterized protein At4g02000-like [Cannabis sativa]
MADLWKPGKGMYVNIIEQNRFLFQFFHEIDIQRVLTVSPWTYDRKQLILERLQRGDNPRTIALNKLDIWVQIHDRQSEFKTDRAIQQAGNYMGVFLESDLKNFQGVWREYLRVRVYLNVDVPLKRRMKFCKKGGEAFYANFKYEKLPTFCFICGIMGHSRCFYSKLYDIPLKEIEKPYSIAMRAPTRKQNFITPSPWLRSSTTEATSYSVDKNSAPTTFTPAPSSKVDLVGSRQLQNNTRGIHGKIVSSSQDSRNVGQRMVNANNDPTFIVIDNQSMFTSNVDMDLVELKRKRIENDSYKANNVAISKEVDHDDEPNNVLNEDSIGLSKNGSSVGLETQAHQTL